MKFPQQEIDELSQQLQVLKEQLWCYNFTRQDITRKAARGGPGAEPDLVRLADAARNLAECAAVISRLAQAVAEKIRVR